MLKPTQLTLTYTEWQNLQLMVERALLEIDNDLYEQREKKQVDYGLKLIGAALMEANRRIKIKLVKPCLKFTLTFTDAQGLALYNAYLEDYISEYDLDTTVLIKTKVAPVLDKAVA